MHLASIADYALYVRQVDPFIGDLPLQQVHLGTLQPFINKRRKEGVKNRTINMAFSIVRRVLNLSARLWRDENGLAWLQTAPLIRMLPMTDAHRPFPLDWAEQRQLFQALPGHLARMCLFKVNTGCREQEVCQLRWDWEVDVPELQTSVFLIPAERVKNRDDRLVVLNRIAKSVVDEVRGEHRTFAFTYRGKRVTNINNSGWKRARVKTGLEMVRVHDLKHTFGRRLRAARVPLETRKVLLGHKNGDITTHYSAPELEELIEAVNRLSTEKSGTGGPAKESAKRVSVRN